MTRYAVIGDPVANSKSPRIHQLFADQFDADVLYEAIQVTSDGLEGFVDRFFSAEGGGLNVTVPHKETAFALCLSTSPQAELARAVYTLMLDSSGQLFGDNTDGRGIVTDITRNYQVPLTGQRVLLIGAGGAARGALPALIEQAPAQIVLVNRTVAKAQTLQNEFAHVARIEASSFDKLNAEPFDVIINATSLSLHGELPPLSPGLITDTTCCYDMMYGDSDTVFVSWAKEQGAGISLDGLGMLVEQAAESFLLWQGMRPQTKPVIAALRG